MIGSTKPTAFLVLQDACFTKLARFFSFRRTIDMKTIFPNLDVNGPCLPAQKIPVQKNLIMDTLFFLPYLIILSGSSWLHIYLVVRAGVISIKYDNTIQNSYQYMLCKNYTNFLSIYVM